MQEPATVACLFLTKALTEGATTAHLQSVQVAFTSCDKRIVLLSPSFYFQNNLATVQLRLCRSIGQLRSRKAVDSKQAGKQANKEQG
ncbi:uncharacterized protein BO95DRAFT_251543 [Aspergillus brunneoviolaceus CBS 621.78]|uniref:Uncharacterized protein n=1 Tax=Aspergillus brunneoviolaceus CBS 621.78 TaxID=1450534 RepID=A0ACD1FYL8_9EURO|nr:hypothetical protein BO95DRAFT_251543 [Aspergillus brunneoviolaceus CBS 621.78]RAH42081.1 hypothetical protein BO95DRAFT_251543 [Aspergillus brunneoviolaceus CBS 621.78]